MLYPVTKLYINSEDRLSGTVENFKYQTVDKNIQYDMVSVSYASIPKSYYQIRDGYNYFILQEGDNGINDQTSVTVPPGNYTRNSFASMLGVLLTNASPKGYLYIIQYPGMNSVETGKFTYTVTGTPQINPSFIFPKGSLLFEQMGFHKDSTNVFQEGKLVSTVISNFASEICLFLRSDMCYNSDTGDNILQEIYTNGVPYMSYIIFENKIPKAYAKRISKQGNIFSFYLTDQYGNVLDLNGVNLHFTLLLWKRDPYKQIVESFIRYKVNEKEIN